MFSDFFGALGASLLGGFDFGGMSGKTLGRTLGRSFGDYLDEELFDEDALESHDLNKLRDMTTDPDHIIPHIFGTVRLAGQILWVSALERNKIKKTFLSAGGWGNKPIKSLDSYTYSVSVAIGLCEGEISHISEIYADGLLCQHLGLSYDLYKGKADQTANDYILSKGDDLGDLKGLAYIVIKDIPLDHFNGRLPKFEFTVVKHTDQHIPLEEDIKALCMIPASGEWVYSTTPLYRDAEFRGVYENMHMSPIQTDFTVTVGKLKENYPHLQNISLVVGWFFDHLDPYHLNIRPGVESLTKDTQPYIWSVAGYARNQARLLSDYNDVKAYGGTPSDSSVREGMIALAQAGYKVTFYPFLFGDISHGHPTLPAYPWRGRIKPIGNDTYRQAAIDHFFDEYNPMVLHYAHMCKEINNSYPESVTLFVIGSELVGLTHSKIGNDFPAVTHLKALAAQVKSILGSSVKVTYAADWTEYGHSFQEGTLDFPLDALWSDNNIDAIGIDWYPPLSDRREMSDHDMDYLKSQIEGGEGYDYYYANDLERENQNSQPITDAAFRVKDIRSWWKNHHHASSGQTSWIPQSKPIFFTEIGCPAVHRGANSPNLFPDIKSSENALPPFSNGQRDDVIQRLLLKSYYDYWNENNEVSDGGVPLLDLDHMSVWCIDARPYPAFPARSDIWSDGAGFFTGHWITARDGYTSLSSIFTQLGALIGVNIIFDAKADHIIDGFAVAQNMSFKSATHDLMRLYQLMAVTVPDGIYITSEI